jgi:type IV pilus assembly protein PilM
VGKNVNANNTYFYKDKSIFGLDIGFSSIKVMQIDTHGDKQTVRGYGVIDFDHTAIQDGVITDYEKVAGAILDMFKNKLIGEVNTRRVALSLPTARTFTRTMDLPALKDDEIAEAVALETEQYIPVPANELYLDYQIINKSKDGISILSVAIPKKITDSYITLIRMLGLEPVAIDTSILAAGRLFQKQHEHSDIPAVLIDFGSMSADITIYDQKIIVTSTIACGGDTFTELIAKKLKISIEEAQLVKTKYGIGRSKKQSEIIEALQENLDLLAKEIRRMIRYHEERSGSDRKIGQVVIMGGGSNMPGLNDYMTSVLRLPVRMCEPWQFLELHKLQPPSSVQKSMYVTVAGLALIEPKELFR